MALEKVKLDKEIKKVHIDGVIRECEKKIDRALRKEYDGEAITIDLTSILRQNYAYLLERVIKKLSRLYGKAGWQLHTTKDRPYDIVLS